MSATTDIIRALRAAGLTQVEISRRTQIPQPRISRWEAGETPDSADDALKLQALHAELCGGVALESDTPTAKAA
jgi:transcriptional regulator with XRE-family HTH domain